MKHADCIGKLRDTGCLFVTSAVESVDDAVLERLEKNHTRADFLRVIEMFREIGLALQPTFVPFTPWTTLEGYCELLEVLREEELVENVAPIQLAIRLLIPAGSRLLELDEIRRGVGDFDEAALVYPWKHARSAGGSLVRADSGNRSFGREDEAQPRANFRANRGCGVCGCRRRHNAERFACAGIAGGGAVLE